MLLLQVKILKNTVLVFGNALNLTIYILIVENQPFSNPLLNTLGILLEQGLHKNIEKTGAITKTSRPTNFMKLDHLLSLSIIKANLSILFS